MFYIILIVGLIYDSPEPRMRDQNNDMKDCDYNNFFELP